MGLHWAIKSVGIVAAAGAIVAAASGSMGGSAVPANVITRWQGPFHYEQEFSTRAAGCSVQGRERIDGVVVCTGADVKALKCVAQGHAERSFQVASSAGATTIERQDAGSYEGP